MTCVCNRRQHIANILGSHQQKQFDAIVTSPAVVGDIFNGDNRIRRKCATQVTTEQGRAELGHYCHTDSNSPSHRLSPTWPSPDFPRPRLTCTVLRFLTTTPVLDVLLLPGMRRQQRLLLQPTVFAVSNSHHTAIRSPTYTRVTHGRDSCTRNRSRVIATSV